MARMRMMLVPGGYLVAMSGHVAARDLRRLERLCGPALEQPRLPLTLRLSRSSTLDLSAQAYFDRLVRRGAVVVSD